MGGGVSPLPHFTAGPRGPDWLRSRPEVLLASVRFLACFLTTSCPSYSTRYTGAPPRGRAWGWREAPGVPFPSSAELAQFHEAWMYVCAGQSDPGSDEMSFRAPLWYAPRIPTTPCHAALRALLPRGSGQAQGRWWLHPC